MIKKFEEFVLECYGRPVNEAFQSSKLREIIKQHGKPKYDFEKKMLYDIQDDEIVDVLDSRSEYFKKYSNKPEDPFDKSEGTFMIELGDGSCVVIGNLGILKSYFDRDLEHRMRDEIKKRHSERHKGNLGKHGGDDIHAKHMANVDKIERRRLAEKLQEYTQDIVDAVQNFMNNMNPEDDDINTEIQLTLGGDKYSLNVVFDLDRSEGDERYGAEYYDIYYSLDGFDIYDDEGTCVTNDELKITSETYRELFKQYTIEDVEGEIYDYYDYYGVKRSDFL